MDHQHAVGARLLQQQIQGLAIFIGAGCVTQVHRILDRIAGSAITRQLRAGRLADLGQMATVPQQSIAGQQRQAVAVAEDGQPVAVDRLGGGQGFGGAE